MNRINIGLITSPLTTGHKVRGIGMYTKFLLDGLNKVTRQAKYKNFKIIPINKDYSQLTKDASIQNLDILHYPFIDLFSKTLYLPSYVKTVITIHDAIPLRYPTHFVPGIKGKLNLLRQMKIISKVSAVITDSETSRKDISHYLKVPIKKIHVTPLAPQFEKGQLPSLKEKNEIKQKYALPEKFVMYVGGVNWNKNLLTLVQACRQINFPLVLVGSQPASIDQILNDSKLLGGPKDILRKLIGFPHPQLAHLNKLREIMDNPLIFKLGFVPEEDLPSIYSLASVYCQPSYWEGFGMNPLEALLSRCPVVSSNTPALKELLEDAAIYIDPFSVDSLAAGLKEALNKKTASRLILAGEKIARNFSWERTATKTLNVYQSLLA